MPFLFISPWREQFFKNVTCPEHVVVPVKDFDAWKTFPKHRWVYDKLAVALSQPGIEAAPHGVIPTKFPVFSKPITNLRGMGNGSKEIKDLKTYMKSFTPGHFWSTKLTGTHYSTDLAVVQGEVKWWRHATAVASPAGGGTFDYFQIHARQIPEVEDYCSDWVRRHLSDYTGMMNIETIGNRIIEVHLRFTDQWPDLYGVGFLQAVVNLFATGVWEFDDPEESREEGFSVILFRPHGPRRFYHPARWIVEEALALEGVKSIQIPFDADKDAKVHPMSPGGFRVAIINSVSLEGGRAARKLLEAEKREGG